MLVWFCNSGWIMSSVTLLSGSPWSSCSTCTLSLYSPSPRDNLGKNSPRGEGLAKTLLGGRGDLSSSGALPRKPWVFRNTLSALSPLSPGGRSYSPHGERPESMTFLRDLDEPISELPLHMLARVRGGGRGLLHERILLYPRPAGSDCNNSI